ncbi:MAG: tRNA (adenosine(37)-N6)-threonylcarbamoyltransferase complex ATPase subunit type 1 TsaE [Candidatus Taylorbacteria bacterium]
MKIHVSNSLEQTTEIATEWLSGLANSVENSRSINLNSGLEREATLVGLSGHLGAGKTAFVKSIAKVLGVQGEITSPTYVIMKMYGINKRYSTVKSSIESIPYPWKRLVHIDAYRLEKYEELEVLGWEQLIADAGNLIIVEWPENAGIDRNKNPELIELGFEIVDDKYNIKEV